MDFIIDTTGNLNNNSHQSSSNSVVKDILKEYKESLLQNNLNTKTHKKSIYEEFSEEMGWGQQKKKVIGNNLESSTLEVTENIDAILQKSAIITPEFEQLHRVPSIGVSEKKLRDRRRKEQQKTKGKKWFGLPATEVTEDVKRDLEVLQMRSVLDPKRFYKKNDLKVLPKYFQIGKVMDSPLDYYNNRLTKKERKKTLVEELLADAEFTKYNKRKYKEIIEEKQKTHYKAWRQAKKLKRKNK